MWQLVELRSRSWILVTLNREQILAFDLKIAKAVAVAEAVKVFIDVDQAHVLGPSGVRSGIAICIQDGESEKFIAIDNFYFFTLNREQILAFDLKIAEAIVVAETVEVLIDVDQAHVLGPSGVGSIQDGESEQFDE